MNLERYTRLFTEVFSVSIDALNEHFTFAGVPQWDSMAHMELIAALEDEFDILLEPEEITNFGSYEHGKQILAAHGVDLG